MKVLYFAWLRQRIGAGEEEIALPQGAATVADLVAHLRARSGGHARAFADMKAVRVAVNQAYVPFDHRLGDSDEVAFFPPVTGG